MMYAEALVHTRPTKEVRPTNPSHLALIDDDDVAGDDLGGLDLALLAVADDGDLEGDAGLELLDDVARLLLLVPADERVSARIARITPKSTRSRRPTARSTAASMQYRIGPRKKDASFSAWFPCVLVSSFHLTLRMRSLASWA
jgi:hypothetical protein